MPSFIQALVAIAMSISTSFTHGGKPAILPVVSQIDVSAHGSAVSAVATNLDPQNQNDQDTNANNQDGNSQSPDTTRVSADNVRAGIQMPSFIPSVALEHSSALEVSVGVLPTPGGQSGNQSSDDEITGSTNINASFGQSTVASVRSNSRRP